MTTTVVADSIKVDSTGKTTVKFSKDSLDAPVDYGCRDSMIFDNTNRLVYLYGEAYINYENLKLTAAYIVINMKDNLATAEPLADSSGRLSGIPNFKDDQQDVKMKKLGYNFKTKKGIAYDATSKYNDLYIHGGKSKFVKGEGSDSTRANDVAYSTDAIFTTCNADHPHFGIKSKKQKVIPDKLIIVGPSNLTIGDIPTPIWLPFAAFPLTKGKRTGLIFPQNYSENELWGFGLQGVGWYFPLTDNYDLKLTGDIYVRGTFNLKADARYQNNYKNSGSLILGFGSTVREDEKANVIRDNSWNIQWSHSQDQRANPNLSFNATVNISGNLGKGNQSYQNTFNNDFRNATSSQFNSTISFTKSFPGKPYSLSGSVQHSQNTNNREVSMTLPNLNFQMQTIFPLKRKKRVGEEKWYEKISLQYSSQLTNDIRTRDSLFLTSRMWDNARFGVQHRANSNVNFNILKYFNFSPFINYDELWYIKQQNRKFDPLSIEARIDTQTNGADTFYTQRITRNGKVDTSFKSGYFRAGTMSMGASLTTRVFGTIQFKKGWLRGIRHTMSPQVSFTYSPDYSRRFLDSVQLDNARPLERQIYNIYDNSIYGTPSNSGLQAAMSWSLTNLFELKTYNRRDSTFKKIKLLENVNINGSYNIAADSFRWSNITMSTGTNFFNGLTNLGINAAFDPYGIDPTGRRVKESALKYNGKLLNLINASMGLNTGISIGQIRDLFKGKTDKKEDNNFSKNGNNNGNSRPPQSQSLNQGEKLEALEDLFSQFRLQHTFVISHTLFNGRDTLTFQNNLYTSGEIPITKKWRIRIGNVGYDFVNKQMTYPDLGISRDLHCWEMGVDWQPQRSIFGFYLRVKPGTLDFLKIPYGRGQQIGLGGSGLGRFGGR
ncbi:MAG: LPS-assembly protein LptD [Saprospiraceae bacterium]|nr:LPS-assembly protein LptD [Saprospiraceae bacterium]